MVLVSFVLVVMLLQLTKTRGLKVVGSAQGSFVTPPPVHCEQWEQSTLCSGNSGNNQLYAVGIVETIKFMQWEHSINQLYAFCQKSFPGTVFQPSLKFEVLNK